VLFLNRCEGAIAGPQRQSIAVDAAGNVGKKDQPSRYMMGRKSRGSGIASAPARLHCAIIFQSEPQGQRVAGTVKRFGVNRQASIPGR